MLFNYRSWMKEECGEIAIDELLDFAIKIASKHINGKKTEILKIISMQKEPRTITSIVDEISFSLGCPKSTVWANICQLKQLGLIKNDHGKPVHLTNLGRLVLLKFLAEKDKPKRRYTIGNVLIYSDSEENLVPV